MQQYWRSYMTIRRDLSASFKNAKAVMLWAKMSGDATLASCQMQVAMSLHHKTQRYVRIFFLTSNGLFWILETFCLYPLRSLDASVLVVPIKGIWCWAVFSPSNFLRWHVPASLVRQRPTIVRVEGVCHSTSDAGFSRVENSSPRDGSVSIGSLKHSLAHHLWRIVPHYRTEIPNQYICNQIASQ